MRQILLSGVFGLAMVAGTTGCDLDGSHDEHGAGRGYRDHSDYRDRDSSTYGDTQGRRNTKVADIQDDGRLNGTARTFEERKASRAADEGVPGAARREAELRDDRLDRR